MTKREMLSRMSAHEFREWQVFDYLEYEDDEKRRKEAAKRGASGATDAEMDE